jgi:D-alanyl-D-alanine carboxypeptidase/D-alanyl-D-alanine-endopeptidase (penicillin-binding protein 4)
LTSCPRSLVVALVLGLSACGGGRAAPAVAPDASARGAVAGLRRDLAGLIAAPELARSTWGVLVKSLARADTLYALQPHTLLLPASNMKIATLAAAAERLGWDYTYETLVVAAGTIHAGALEGDLVVVGSGDPSIDNWDGFADRLFEDWAVRLKAQGVRAVNGRVVGDDNAFDDEPLGAGWAWDDLSAGFAAGVSALQFNQNTVRLEILSGPAVGDRAVVRAPLGTGLVVSSEIMTSAADLDSAITLRRWPGSPLLELRGSIPIGSAPLFRNASVDNPTLYFVASLRQALIANGIEVSGAAVDIDEIADAPPRGTAAQMLVHRSPPLSTLAATMMKLSQNLYAETLLKTLGRAAATDAGAGRQAAAFPAGRLETASRLEQWGIAPGELQLADGSGLSRYNLATPAALVAILAFVDSREELRDPFVEALPVAGRDGTLAHRMRGTAAEGNARAKTGALSNVRALSGYVRTAEGEPLVFSIIANNFGTTAELIERTADAIVVRLAEFRR